MSADADTDTATRSMLATIGGDPALLAMLDNACTAGILAANKGMIDGDNPHATTSLFAIAWAAGWYATWRTMQTGGQPPH